MENSAPDQYLNIMRKSNSTDICITYPKKEFEKIHGNLLKYFPEESSIQLYTDIVSYAERNITWNLTVSFNY